LLDSPAFGFPPGPIIFRGFYPAGQMVSFFSRSSKISSNSIRSSRIRIRKPERKWTAM